MIPDDVVERVRDEADIVQIVGEFVKLKRVGNSYRGPCPFHQGTHDNFAVSPKGGYICFVCGEKGDVFTFIEKRLGLDFIESVKWVGAKAGVDVTEVKRQVEGPDPREPLYEVNGAAADWFQQQLRDERQGATAREYIGSRGLSLDDAARFMIGYAPREIGLMRTYLKSLGFDDARQIEAGLLVLREGQEEPRPRFRGRLMFPIVDVKGRVVGFGGRIMGEGEPKYLNSAESDIFSKRKLLYGLTWAKQAIRKTDRVIVVEGYFDAIRLMLAGVDEVVAPMGTAMTEAQAAVLRRYTRNAILLYDSDLPGQKATFRSGDELLRNGMSVRVITLPEGDDPDTFVARVGADGLQRAVNDAIDVFDRKVQILQRGGWFADLRRKREALDKLLPTIRAAADPLMRDLYIARTAEVAGVSRELLERELNEREEGSGARDAGRGTRDAESEPRQGGDAPEGRRPRGSDRRRNLKSRGGRAEHELVRVLLHEPRFIERTAEQLGPDSFLDDVYRRIYTALVELGHEASPEALALKLDAEAVERMQSLLLEQGLGVVDQIVIGSVNSLIARGIKREMEQIQADMAIAGSEEEKDKLLAKKTALKNELNSLGQSHWPMFTRSRS